MAEKRVTIIKVSVFRGPQCDLLVLLSTLPCGFWAGEYSEMTLEVEKGNGEEYARANFPGVELTVQDAQ